MAAWGNAMVVGAFRGDGEPGVGETAGSGAEGEQRGEGDAAAAGAYGDGGVNPALRRRAARWVVLFLLAVQVAVLGVQVWQLWRYDAAIAPYMPTMTREGYAPVVTNFE